MKIERIEMFGFKSFHDRMKITLDNLTGIVGPNGCGKSNVVDAIRWILGENRLSNLRGNSYEDVIFSGSATKSPMSLAEVTLYITSEKSIFADIVTDNVKELQLRYGWLGYAQELEITRRVFRDGQSQFLVNKTEVKLKQLRELIKILGLNPNGFTIVAQGEVNRIVTSKATDRHQIFEIASGISGIKSRIEEIKITLDEIARDQSTLGVLVDDSKTRVESLEKQVKKYRQYQSDISELKEAQLELKQATFRAVRERIAEIDKSLADIGQKIDTSSIETEIKKIDEEIFFLEDDLEAKKKRVEILSARRHEEESKYKQLNERFSYSENVFHQLNGNRKYYEREIEKLQNSQANLRRDLDTLRHELKAQEAALPDASAINASLKQVNSQLSTVSKDLEEIHKSSRELNNTVIKLESTRVALTEELKAISLTNVPETIEGRRLFEVLKIRDQSYAAIIATVLPLRSVILNELEALRLLRSQLRFDGVIEKMISDNISLELNSEPFRQVKELIEVETPYQELVNSLVDNKFFLEDLRELVDSFSWSMLGNSIVLIRNQGLIISREGVAVIKENNQDASVLRLRARIDSLNSDLETKEKDLDAINAKLLPLNEMQATLRSEYSSLTEKLQITYKRINEAQVNIGGIKGRILASEKILGDVERDIRSHKEKIVKSEREIQIAEEKYQSAKSDLSRFEFTVKEEDINLDDVNFQLQECYRLKQPLLNRLQETIRINESIHIRQKKLDKEKSIAEYQLSELQEDPNFKPADQPIRNIDKLRSEISRLHKATDVVVNTESVHLFDIEFDKYSKLNGEYQQLAAARAKLQESLEQLVEDATKRFTRTFNAVQLTFREIISTLFIGGEGDIYLTDVNDPLNCGIEIKVRPGGKRFKNLDLLSGGEKAITAISLMLSLFKQHPSPLCVLDEVDAPLDEANVERFITLIKEWSKNIQFLVITHNKRSMVEMDKLVGVTMNEPGTSQVVSVAL